MKKSNAMKPDNVSLRQINTSALASPIVLKYSWYISSVSEHFMLSTHLLYSASRLQHEQTSYWIPVTVLSR